MKNYDSMYELQKNAAGVLENYLKSQNNQLMEMSKSLKSDTVQSAQEQQVIYECITNIQNNSIKALQTYFEGQTAMINEKQLDN